MFSANMETPSYHSPLYFCFPLNKISLSTAHCLSLSAHILLERCLKHINLFSGFCKQTLYYICNFHTFCLSTFQRFFQFFPLLSFLLTTFLGWECCNSYNLSCDNHNTNFQIVLLYSNEKELHHHKWYISNVAHNLYTLSYQLLLLCVSLFSISFLGWVVCNINNRQKCYFFAYRQLRMVFDFVNSKIAINSIEFFSPFF